MNDKKRANMVILLTESQWAPLLTPQWKSLIHTWNEIISADWSRHSTFHFRCGTLGPPCWWPVVMLSSQIKGVQSAKSRVPALARNLVKCKKHAALNRPRYWVRQDDFLYFPLALVEKLKKILVCNADLWTLLQTLPFTKNWRWSSKNFILHIKQSGNIPAVINTGDYLRWRNRLQIDQSERDCEWPKVLFQFVQSIQRLPVNFSITLFQRLMHWKEAVVHELDNYNFFLWSFMFGLPSLYGIPTRRKGCDG